MKFGKAICSTLNANCIEFLTKFFNGEVNEMGISVYGFDTELVHASNSNLIQVCKSFVGVEDLKHPTIAGLS